MSLPFKTEALYWFVLNMADSGKYMFIFWTSRAVKLNVAVAKIFNLNVIYMVVRC